MFEIIMKFTLIWILFGAYLIHDITSTKHSSRADLHKLAMQMQFVLCKLNTLDHSINKLIAKGDQMCQWSIPADGASRICPIQPSEQFVKELDCADVKAANASSASGIYTINVSGKNTSVYCDMDTDNGGWLVFQRREDGSENFFRNWEDYKNGFGQLDGEFWIGNEPLHLITSQNTYELRVDLADFEGATRYAVYSNFSIDNEDNLYKLSLGSYSGNAGNSLGGHNNLYFSTIDANNDVNGWNCSYFFKGGWWYDACHVANLNGPYVMGYHEDVGVGINWAHFKGYHYSLKFTEMKIRPSV